MTGKSRSVAILGGGPCGLYAARVLTRQGYKVTLIDKGIRPGGLATSHRCGNNWYDMGVHMLHAFDQEIFHDIKNIMGDEMIEVELNAKIKWAGGSYRYPLQFQDMIKGIPFFKLCKQVSALFGAQLKNQISPWTPVNAEEALIQLYGKPLYKFFFEDFTHRYWEMHPKELSATFITKKMPKLTAVDVLKKGLEKIGIKQKAKTVDSALTKETLYYSRNGAEAMPRCLSRAIQEAGGNVLQSAEVKKIIPDGRRIKSIIYEKENQSHELTCDEFISTIPLNHLIHSFASEVPEPVKNAVKTIRYKPIVIYGLLVKKPKCLDALYIYYRDRVFHRIGEPKNAGLKVNPPDHTILIVEMTCNYDDAKWRGEGSIMQRLHEDLIAEEICTPEEIVEVHINRCETGYPIFSLGFEPHLEAVHNYINTFDNLQTVGRQGDFSYPNMHSAMRMGWNAADKIIRGKN